MPVGSSSDFKTWKVIENMRQSYGKYLFNHFGGVLKFEEDLPTSVRTDFLNSSVLCKKIEKKVGLIYIFSSSDFKP